MPDDSEYYEDSDVEMYEGPVNKEGRPHGRGTVFLDSQRVEKYEGRFVNGKKSGKGTFYFGDGSSLSGVFRNDCLEGQGVYLYNDGSSLIGTYVEGELHGYAEAYDSNDKLTFKGRYKHNIRTGLCHYFYEHGGHLFGVVDGDGCFTGNAMVYEYPDEKTFLKGVFDEGELVFAYEAAYVGVGDKENSHSYKKIPNSPEYRKDVSTHSTISADPLLADCYERKRVTVKRSTIADANEGLFSLINCNAGEVMSFYNGVRLQHAEVDERDWKFNDNTISLDDEIVIDVPLTYSDTSVYCASLGHKANHSFQPNSKYDRFLHPRFGEIKCIRTMQPVSIGDELTVDYDYNHKKLETDAPFWYKEKLKIYENLGK